MDTVQDKTDIEKGREAQSLEQMGFTRHEYNDEIEFRQTGSSPVYYEQDFKRIDRCICSSRTLNGKWKTTVSDNEGNVLYNVALQDVATVVETFIELSGEVSATNRKLEMNEFTWNHE